MEELNVLDKPLHSSESELTLKQSCFRVIEFAEFSNLKPKEFREVIRSQTVITVDKNAIPGNFNMDSLLQFQSLSTMFDIEGIWYIHISVGIFTDSNNFLKISVQSTQPCAAVLLVISSNAPNKTRPGK